MRVSLFRYAFVFYWCNAVPLFYDVPGDEHLPPEASHVRYLFPHPASRVAS